MSARDAILERVRAALAPLTERAAYPEFADDAAVMHQLFPEGGDRWKLFVERVRLVNGIAFSSAGEVGTWLREHDCLRGYCDPELLPVFAEALGEGFTVETEFDRARVDDYSFGITRADAGIAESGTVILRDASTSSRLGALTPWVHVAVFPRAKLYATIPEAIAKLGGDPNIVFVTGPSKTADVEGILIEGVHGPGVQIVVGLE